MTKISGTEKADKLNGTGGDDTLNGLGGADTLAGNSGNDQLNGGEGNDVLQGGDGNDHLDGGAGNDTLDGGVGNDRIDGGDGFDVVSYATLKKSIYVDLSTTKPSVTDVGEDVYLSIEGVTGTKYDDTLIGGTSDNTFTGGDGNDALSGHEGNDQLSGGAGNDVLDGGAGDDKLDGGNGFDTVSYATATSGVHATLLGKTNTVGAGTDTLIGIEALTGSKFADVLLGGKGNDTLNGGAGIDTINAGAGDDTVLVTHNKDAAGGETVDGGDGYDILKLFDDPFEQKNTIDLTGLKLKHVEELQSQGAFDIVISTDALSSLTKIAAHGADLALTGSGVADLRHANSDATRFVFASADITLRLDNSKLNIETYGSSGKDVVYSGLGVDHLTGLEGDDTLSGGAGDDQISGGSGNDMLSGGAGNDEIDDQGGDNIIGGGAGDDNVVGGTASDIITGDDGNDRLQGLKGNDTLRGGEGNDLLFGGAGSNLIDGGNGNDDLYIDSGSTNVVKGGTGDDVIYGDGGLNKSQEISGGDGNDVLQTFQGIVDITRCTLTSIERVTGSNQYVMTADQVGALTYIDSDELVIAGGGDGLGAKFLSISPEITITGENVILDASNFSGHKLLIAGGAFADVIYSGTRDDEITGGDGNDLLDGGGGLDLIQGGNGNDTLDGGDGADDLNGQSGDDVLIGGAGNDIISDVSGQNTLSGGDGNDDLSALQTSTLNGGAGDDHLEAWNYTGMVINGGDGIDTLTIDHGSDLSDVQIGTDVEILKGNATLTAAQLASFTTIVANSITLATGGTVDMTGHHAANLTVKFSGNDTTLILPKDNAATSKFTVNGGTGNDVVHGGNLSDVLSGDGGDDQLFGGDGGDDLVGGGGVNILDGGAGNDRLHLDKTSTLTSDVKIRGGDGYDIFYASGATVTMDLTVLEITGVEEISGSSITVSRAQLETLGGLSATNVHIADAGALDLTGVTLKSVNPTFFLNDGGNTFAAPYLGNLTFAVVGGAGDDVITAKFGNFNGGGGDDQITMLADATIGIILHGNADNDTLIGGSGADKLFGDAGADTMTGKAGADTFVFAAGDMIAGSNPASADHILDFSQSEHDVIDLKAIDAKTGVANSVFTFIGQDAFGSHAGELRYEQGATETDIFGDSNGDGVADFMIRLDGQFTLVAGDFVL